VTPKKGGFTLIELLVVISIIGMLSSIVLASLNSARAKARDAKRLSELNTLQTALEFYYDKYGFYPYWNQASIGRDCSGWRGTSQDNNTFMQLLVDEGFIPSPISDTIKGGNCRIQYKSGTGNLSYRIVFKQELNNDDYIKTSCYNGGGWACIGVNY